TCRSLGRHQKSRNSAALSTCFLCLLEGRAVPMDHAKPDPDELLQRARAGDRSALGQLLQRYRNYLALLARYQIDRRLQGKVDASDLIQETFLEAHRDFAQFRGRTESELGNWLRRILANNLANEVARYCGSRRR